MPLYEYECDACGHRFEVIQKYSDALIETCPKCGGKVQKLLSSPAIQFKGSGFYITDYARAGKSDSAATSAGKTAPTSDAAASKSTDGSSSGSSSSSSTTSESTPAKSDSATPPAKSS